jgi:spore germination protein GerM
VTATTRRLSRFATAVVAASVLAGCGIPLDGSPRTINASAQNPAQQGTTRLGSNTAYFYYLRNEHLTVVGRDVTSLEPATVLTQLVAATPAGVTDTGKVSQIPPGTAVRSVGLVGDLLHVDLSSDFDNVIGANRQQAIAQIVFTLTELPEVERLTFAVGGRAATVSSPARGDVSVVSDCDYATLLPTDDEIRQDQLDPDATKKITSRRKSIESRCAGTTNTNPS